MIQSLTTRQFRKVYADLPEEVRRQARQAYVLFKKNPHHPSLRFKKVDKESNTYAVRVSLGYRALGVMEGSTIIWYWIGTHADYDKLL